MLGDLVESMKRAALDVMRNANLTAVLFGEVINDEPLQIMVEQRLTLDEEFLVLTRNVTDYDVDVTIKWVSDSALESHRHSFGARTSDSGGDPSHTHHIGGGSTNSVDLSHEHEITGRKTMTVHAGLQIGEIVLLIRQEGGQKYIVVDRVV